ncbi:MAG: hypothetical protein ACJ761_04790 [Chloroflexota bacterium]
MRRWVCLIALLTGFTGERYVWAARRPMPVPIERPVQPATRPGGLRRTADWWART